MDWATPSVPNGARGRGLNEYQAFAADGGRRDIGPPRLKRVAFARQQYTVPKAYIEPNIINWARRTGWSGDELRTRLRRRDIDPHFGLHGIYELARGFRSPSARTDAQRNFQIVAQLDPVYGPTPDMLLDKELDQLRTGAAVIPTLDAMNHASAKYQVARMAEGLFEPEGEEFVREREANIQRDHPKYTAYQLREVRQTIGAGAHQPTTFEEVVTVLDSEVPSMIRQILGNRATALEAAELHGRLDRFPALRSIVRANLYLWAIPILHDTGASLDKLDDYRHVVEASYADVFVTGDGQLARTVPRIHPGLLVVNWDEVKAG